MLQRVLFSVLLTLPLAAQDRAWKASIVALAGASAADYSSSLGRQEINPLLRGADGRFSPARGLAFKAGVPVAAIVGQAKAPRRYRKLWAVVNFALAAEFTYAAVHNMRQR